MRRGRRGRRDRRDRRDRRVKRVREVGQLLKICTAAGDRASEIRTRGAIVFSLYASLSLDGRRFA